MPFLDGIWVHGPSFLAVVILRQPHAVTDSSVNVVRVYALIFGVLVATAAILIRYGVRPSLLLHRAVIRGRHGRRRLRRPVAFTAQEGGRLRDRPSRIRARRVV